MPTEYKEDFIIKERIVAVDVRYDKSFNWSGFIKRGYWVSVTPLKNKKLTEDGMVIREYDPMEGFNDLLLEVERKSPNNLAKAIAIYNEKLPKYKESLEKTLK